MKNKNNNEKSINYYLENCRTDLAIELEEKFSEDGKENGIKVNYDKVEGYDIFINQVEVLNEVGSENIGKPVGKYITIECEEMKGADRQLHDIIIGVTTNKINELINIEQDERVLIVGLGNEYVTPDAIGPKAISKIIVTGHIYDVWDKDVRESFSRVFAIAPGVMGQTGIETVDVVKGIVEKVKPKSVIVIDALSGRKIDRINNTIQISNSGITPGSGIGNNRKGLNKETLGVEVIAIGVPTVISTSTLICDSMESIIEELAKNTSVDENLSAILNIDDEKKYNIVRKLFEPYTSNMFVTPKEIDQVIDRLSNIIANAINLSINKGLNQEDINDFMV